MRTTEIVMFNGLDELDVVAPFEIIVSAGYQVGLVTLEPCRSVTGRHGMTLTPGGLLGPRRTCSSFPGGGWASKASDSAWGEGRRGAIPAAIAERHAVTVTTGEQYHLKDAAAAHHDLEARRTHGSTVLTL